MWVCTSIPAGITYRPAASMTVSAPAPVPDSVRPVPMAWIRSPSISTSARAMSVAVTTVPFLISVVIWSSWQFSLGLSGAAPSREPTPSRQFSLGLSGAAPSREPTPSRELEGQLAVGLRPPGAEELPGVAHLADLVQVDVGDQHLVFAVRGLGDDLPARAAEIGGAVELVRVQRRLDADPVAGRDPEPVGHRVRRLLELPQVL